MLSYVSKLKNQLFVALLILPLFCFSAEDVKSEDIVVRAALDIGSGATKLKVAQVNLKTQKIVKVLVNESFPVQYQEELEKSTNNTFNEQVMNTGLDALKKSQEIAYKYGAQKVVAIATASFRKAANVQEFLDRIYSETGIQVYIIDQQLEGILGFEATASQFNVRPEDLVVWDIGGGSFQFSTVDEDGEIIVHRGLDASIPFKNHIIKEIKLEDPNVVTTPNPLSRIELRDAEYHARQISKKVDEVFKSKIGNRNTKVVGIGNIFAYGIYPLIGKKSTFSQEDLFQKVQALDGKADRDLGDGAYVNVAVSNPILVLGFMQTLGIREMDIIDINNADGALLYPSFWEVSSDLRLSVN